MKNLAFVNLIFAVLFAIMLRLSAFCFLSHYLHGSRTTEMKMYGIQIVDFSVSWRVVLVIIILLFIAYLVCLFKLLITSVKLKHLSLKLSKNQVILIIISLVIVISSVIIAAFEREEYGSIRISPHASIDSPIRPLQPYYHSISVDVHNEGYIILTNTDGEIKMRASSKAIDAVDKILNSEDIVLVMISYRKNILFSTEYKISGIRNLGKDIVFYVSHLKRHDDFSLVDLAATRRDYKE